MHLKWKPINPSIASKCWRTIALPIILALVLSTPVLPDSISHRALAATPVTYYVDCVGNDANAGTSAALAWKSLARANKAKLLPGDKLLFKRGCTFAGTLNAYWNGSSTAMITIGAYGSGALPKIQNNATDLGDKYYNAVDVQGSYLQIEYLEVTTVNPPVDANCRNNPIGFFVGFNFRNPNNTASSGSNNLLRFSKATHFTAGVQTTTNTHEDRILQNTFSDNYVMQVLTPVSVGTTDDIGAWGVLLRGNKHEVGYNYLSNNNAFCSYDTPAQGNAIELYEATNNTIHHNTSVNDRTFSELGGSASLKSRNNSFVYNLVYSTRPDAYFIIVRGGGNQFGPTYTTYLYQNTVYYTGPDSQGVICHSGCGTDILTMKNNIIWSELKTVYADAAFTESNNIYWSTDGTPYQQLTGFKLSASSRAMNPQFVDLPNRNFKLKATSPAVNTGAALTWGKDHDNNPAPQGTNYDIGAFEYSSVALSDGVFLAIASGN